MRMMNSRDAKGGRAGGGGRPGAGGRAGGGRMAGGRAAGGARRQERGGASGGGREPGKCRYCREKTSEIDYKDLGNLQRMLSAQGKMLTRKRSGLCALHQRSARLAIKRARFIGLLPFVA